MLLLSLLSTFLFATSTESSYHLPEPEGPYNVGFTQHVFNHTTLSDPTSPNGVGTFFLCSIYYPTLSSPSNRTRVPYVDPISAAEWGEVHNLSATDLLSIETYLQWQADVLPKEHAKKVSKYPTLVFSPGGGSNSFLYTAFLSDLASQGYTVLAVDHPGESVYLRLPYNASGVDGFSIFMPWNFTLAEQLYNVRISDMIALLSADGFPALVDQYGAPFNTTAYAIFGHSLGGAIAAGVMGRLDSIVAGVNMDGAFFGDSVNASLGGRPFFMPAAHNHTKEADPTWTTFIDRYAAEGGWLDYFTVTTAGHQSFGDIPLWIEMLPQVPSTNRTKPWVDFGTISGTRAHKLYKAYLGAFWEFVRSGDCDEGLLDRPSSNWPEVWFNKTIRP